MAFGSLPSVLGSGGGTAYNLIGGTGLFADGTAAAPSMSFLSDSNTGFYDVSSGNVGFSSDGAVSLYFGAGGIIQAAGFAGYLTLASAGQVALTAGGTNKNITLTPSGTGAVFSTGPVILKASYVDSGNGKIQLDTHTTSAGGIGFGTDNYVYRFSSSNLVYGTTHATLAKFSLIANSGSGGACSLSASSNDLVLSGYAQTVLQTNNGATALTLDSSQNATFAGTVKPQLATTAGAPAYVKGAIYFDTTLNKLRVGGAAAWETITSV